MTDDATIGAIAKEYSEIKSTLASLEKQIKNLSLPLTKLSQALTDSPYSLSTDPEAVSLQLLSDGTRIPSSTFTHLYNLIQERNDSLTHKHDLETQLRRLGLGNILETPHPIDLPLPQPNHSP